MGSAERIRQVAGIIRADQRPRIVVLSAVAGTTNQLDAIGQAHRQGQAAQAQLLLQDLRDQYRSLLSELFDDHAWRSKAADQVHECLDTVGRCTREVYSQTSHNTILAQGELISTRIFQLYLQSQGAASALLPAFDFMLTDADGEPDTAYLRERLDLLLEAYRDAPLLITQGYICLNHAGRIDNLQRGGSDYTATLIGAAVRAEEIEIWTDIDGLHNNDPRVVEDTRPVRRVSYREAAELAYFGAKILHPTCVIPAEKENIPVRLKNTFAPAAPGTLISARGSGQGLTAIAAKDGITAIRIRSGRMLNAYGFLRQVFEIFERYRTPIDMITTSEVSVSLTIDRDEQLPRIVAELEHYGTVSVDRDQTIICIVGDALDQQTGYTPDIFAALRTVNVRMVSYGGSQNNISILVGKEDKEPALRSLHRQLFSRERAGIA